LLSHDLRNYTSTSISINNLLKETDDLTEVKTYTKLLEQDCSDEMSFLQGIIEISLQKDDKNIQIKVQDQGIGFEQKLSGQLFERFSKHSRRGTHKEATLGIGLYLTQQIIALHNGTINASSKGINQGATFVIILPCSS
jgi:signal transduction histidine kinase